MQLKRIILPEVLLGRRGDPAAIKMYRENTKDILRIKDPGTERVRWKIPVYHNKGAALDTNLANHHLLCRLFKENNGKVYYLNKDFAQALSGIDREIPLDVLPQSFTGYIQFAPGALKDDSGEIDGALVCLSTVEYMGFTPEEGASPQDLCISISYGNTHPHPEFGPVVVCKFASALKKMHTIKDLFEAYKGVDIFRDEQTRIIPSEGARDKRLPIIRAILNALVYIHSSDPDIEKLAPLAEFSNKKRAEVKAKQSVPNLLTVPVTLLNWKYHASSIYNVDSTTVSAHMRWQRCGEGLSKVKLILIQEHIRNYK